jgi:hypothetical protein
VSALVELFGREVLLEDAAVRYRDSRRRRELALEAWLEAGSPTVVEHANRVLGVHPALTVLNDLERHCDRLMRSLWQAVPPAWRRPGPHQVSEMSPLHRELADELAPASELRRKREDG